MEKMQNNTATTPNSNPKPRRRFYGNKNRKPKAVDTNLEQVTKTDSVTAKPLVSEDASQKTAKKTTSRMKTEHKKPHNSAPKKPRNTRNTKEEVSTNTAETTPKAEATSNTAEQSKKLTRNPRAKRPHSQNGRGRKPQRYSPDDTIFAGISEIGEGGYAKPSWYSPKKRS